MSLRPNLILNLGCLLFIFQFLIIEGCATAKGDFQTRIQGSQSPELVSETLDNAKINERFLLPKKNERNVIYLMVAMNELNTPSSYELSPKHKIDLLSIIHEKRLNKDELSKTDLFRLLLDVELRIRTLLKEQPNFMRAVLYVGQAKDLMQRSTQHRADVLKEVKRYQSSKVRWIYHVLDRHFVRLDYAIKNIPPEHLSVFESLVGHLFSVLDFKGSAQLGTTASFKILIEYFSSPTRVDHLRALGLLDSMEKDREKLREMILPFQQPWSMLIRAYETP